MLTATPIKWAATLSSRCLICGLGHDLWYSHLGWRIECRCAAVGTKDGARDRGEQRSLGCWNV